MFDTLGGLFSYYHELRASLCTVPTNMPDCEVIRSGMNPGDPVKARDLVEYRKAMVGDVQIYLYRLPWYDSTVLVGRNPPPGYKQITWRRLVKDLRRMSHGRGYPKSYLSHGNLFRRYKDKIKPVAEAHFRAIGYLRQPI